MKKRILSVLLVVAMLATMIVMPVYADGNATVNTKERCPHCNKTWTELKDAGQIIELAGIEGATSTNRYNMTEANGYTGGHYRLMGDITSTKTTNVIAVGISNEEFVIDLNGHSVTMTTNKGKCFVFGGSVNGSEAWILDSDQDNDPATVGSLNSSVIGGAGNAIYMGGDGEGNTVNIYDITISDSTSSKYDGDCAGLYITAGSTANMYSGTINGKSTIAKVVAPVALVGANATFNMYGGTVNAASGKNAIASDGDKTSQIINIQGGTVNGPVVLDNPTGEGNQIKVSGNPVITNLDLTNGAIVTVGALTQGASIGVTAAANTAFTNTLDEATGQSYAANYFTSNVGGQAVKYDATTSALILGVATIVQACPHCNGENATFAAYEHVGGGSQTTPGHYYLPATVSYSGSEFSVGSTAGDIVIDFHGNSVTNGNRAFSIKANTNVFMMDSVGGSVITGGHKTRQGSSILVNSGAALTLYSGSYTQKAANTTSNNGGVIHSSGDLTITGTAKVYGGKATGIGGNIFAASGSSVTISENAQVYGGQAASGADIYSAGAEITIADTVTGNIKIGMPNSMITSGEAIRYFTYLGTEQNPELTLIVDNSALDCNGAAIIVKDGEMYVAEGTALAKQNGEDAEYTWFNTAAEAVAAYDAGGYDYIVVYGQDLALTGSEYIIDINGFDIEMTADAATTAYCFDSANHKYVAYGNVTANANVTVKSINDSDAQITRASAGAYILLENEGAYSVHALDMDVSAIGLKTASNGMYYYANYKCDDTLKAEILSYGIEYALYDENETAPIAGTTTQVIEIENDGEGALVTKKDIAIGGMNGVIGSDINGYTDAECGKMKIMATPVIAVGNQVISGATVGYSMFDCCQAVYDMIAACNAAGDTETAARYTELMNNLFTQTWAEYELDSWVFENVPETVA